MPISEDGKTRIDLILNPLGVINRLNPSQLYEIHINALSNYIVEELEKIYDKEGLSETLEEFFFDYIYNMNKNEYDKLYDYYYELSEEEQVDFFEDIFENGIYIHQPPFWNNLNLDDMIEISKTYPNFKPKKFIDIEEPIIAGEIYMIKLKHEAAGKLSVRSSSYLNLKNLPSKSAGLKDGALYSTTPIKIGEMELTNMFLSKDFDNIARFISCYSANENNRVNMIKTLLTDDNVFNIDKIDVTDAKSKTANIIDVYLKCIGLELDRNKNKD